MKRKKHTVDELTRLAFVHAEQDARGLAESWSGVTSDTSQYEKYEELANQFRDYRVKRWGRTALEATFDNAKLVSVDELRKKNQ